MSNVGNNLAGERWRVREPVARQGLGRRRPGLLRLAAWVGFDCFRSLKRMKCIPGFLRIRKSIFQVVVPQRLTGQNNGTSFWNFRNYLDNQPSAGLFFSGGPYTMSFREWHRRLAPPTLFDKNFSTPGLTLARTMPKTPRPAIWGLGLDLP
jgi:hypothetical protein